MDRLHSQRGYTRTSKLFLLGVVVAIVYLGVTFWPVGMMYYRIRTDARRIANQGFNNQNTEELVGKFMRATFEQDGINLYRTDINYDRTEPKVIRVSVDVRLPFTYPLTGKVRMWRTRIAVHAEKARGF